MFTLKNNHYNTLSGLLCDRINTDDFFSGSISYTLDSIDCEFISTMMIYREKDTTAPPFSSTISNIVAVWWEFHTTKDGEELLNDFDFQLLKDSICQA